MIQKSHPALLQPHDVGDSVETLMVNAYGRRREGRIPGRPLGEVAKGPWSGSGGGEPFSRPRHAQSWGLVGTDDGEEGGEDCSAFRLGRQSKGRAVAVVSEMGGIAGVLEGFGKMCPQGPERDAIAPGRCLELDALSGRGEKTPGHVNTWAISRPSDVVKPGKLGQLRAGRVTTFGSPAAACGESGAVGGAARPRPLASGLAAAVRSLGHHW